MKLKVIIPVSSGNSDELVTKFFNQYKLSDIQIDVTHLARAPREIASHSDAAKALPYVLEEVQITEQEGYHGIIIYCFRDPGVRVARERVRIPIVGLGETALTYAYFLGHRFSIIASGKNLHRKKSGFERMCLEYGVLDKLTSVRTLGYSPLEIHSVRGGTIEEIMIEQINKAKDEDLADTVVLACGAMIGCLHDHEICQEVLVVDSGIIALNFIESLMNLGLSHSKLGHIG